MLLSVIFIGCQFIGGLLVVDFLDPQKKFSRLERILSGMTLGGILSAFFILTAAVLSRSLGIGIWSYFSVSLIVFLLLRRRLLANVRELFPWDAKNLRQHFSLKNSWALFLLVILIIYWILLSSVLSVHNGLLKASLAGWGDSAFHIDMIRYFSASQPFVIHHPILAGGHLTYSFIINFISAVFLKLDPNLISAFRIPLFIYGTCALLLLFAVAYRILRSRSWAVVALMIILAGSGLGFFAFFSDISNANATPLGFLQNPPQEYTHLDNRTGAKVATNYNIIWIVPVISFLSHQRSFAIGLAVFLILLLGILAYGNSASFWRFGIIAGLLPLTHIHSFLALFFLMAVLFWFYLKEWKNWLLFGFTCSVIALPQIFYLTSGGAAARFFKFKLWFAWMMCEHVFSWLACSPYPGTDTNPLFFWTKNFGAVFLLWLFSLVVAIFFVIKKKDSIVFALPFVLASAFLFIIPNTVLFQPWPFDNNKLLFYWWIIAIVFCCVPLLQWLWKHHAPLKLLVIFLCIVAVFSGAIDIASRVVSPARAYYGYSDSGENIQEAVMWIKNNTKSNSLFLTAPSIDPAPLFLAGRPVYLGYEGWIWSEGLDYSAYFMKAKAMVQGNMELACSEHIDYIFLDENLRRSFPDLNETALLSNGEIVFTLHNTLHTNYIIKTPCQ